MPQACPTIVELEAYLDVGSEAGVGDHVRACSECRERIDEMRANARFLADFTRQAAQFRASRAVSGDDAVREFAAPPAGYTIRRVLGRGGQAVVYEAVQESTKRRVALKVVRLGARDAARRLRRFDREIELVSHLRHPLIVTVFDSGITSEGDPYLVMEYIEGEPIAHRPGEPVRETLARFRHVCDAIRHAHRHGVVHRDIKPSNILVDGQGLPRVLDFGLATTMEPQGVQDLTLSGEFLGTPIYAAPEQLQSGAAYADVRTDIYALGTVLYELLTGAHPFGPHPALADLVQSILEQAPPAPSERANGVDADIDTIVLKSIAKEPERRYASVDALDDDIGRYLRGDPIDARRDSRWYVLRKVARRHRWAVAGAVALIALLAGFGAVMSALYQQASETSRKLAHALATSDLDRGIELARSDSLVSAEPLLWEALLSRMNRSASIASCATGSLLQRRAYWALWELYHRQPCIATVKLGVERVRLVEVEAADRIIAATVKGDVVQWNPQRGETTVLFAPEDRLEPSASVAIRRDVNRVLTASDVEISCWALEENRLVARWELPGGDDVVRFSNLAMTPWGLSVASGHEDGVVRVWRVDDGQLQWTIPTHAEPFSIHLEEHTGRVWMAGAGHVPFTVFDPTTGATFVSRESTWAGRLTVGTDGRFIHSGAIWSGEDEKLLVTLEESTLTRVYNWRFSGSGATIAGGGSTTPVWRADTGKLMRALASHDASVYAIGPADRTVATAHADGSVRAWDVTPDAGVRRIPVSDTAHCVRFDEAGRRLVVAGAGPADEAFLRIIGTAPDAADVLPPDGANTKVVAAAVFLPGDSQLVTGDHAGVVSAWRIEGERLIRDVQVTLPGPINAVASAPDGRWIAVACDDGNLYVWRPGDGQPHVLRGHLTRVSSVAVTSDGAQLITGSSDATVRRWDAASGASLGVLGGHNGPVRAVACSPDDRLIASAGDDQRVHIWNASSGELLHRLTGYGIRVFALAFSPDGRLLASGDAGGGVKLWDVESGIELAALYGHEDMVFSLDFSPEGNRLASGAADRTVRVWDLRFFERHMRGNLDYQRAKRDGETERFTDTH